MQHLLSGLTNAKTTTKHSLVIKFYTIQIKASPSSVSKPEWLNRCRFLENLAVYSSWCNKYRLLVNFPWFRWMSRKVEVFSSHFFQHLWNHMRLRRSIKRNVLLSYAKIAIIVFIDVSQMSLCYMVDNTITKNSIKWKIPLGNVQYCGN